MIVYNGGVQVYPPQRKKYREKNEFIFKYQTKFEKGFMSTSDFFHKMEELAEDSDDEIDEDNDESIDEDDEDNMLCINCNLNEKSVLLEPCNHLKICQHCLNSLKENTTKLTCPACESEVTGHRIAFF